MDQHRLNSLAIICIERTYGNQVIVSSIDKMTDIFGQRHGRKNFFFQYVLDDIETVDIIKYANFRLSYFPMIAVSLAGKTSASMSNMISIKNNIYTGILKLLMPTNTYKVLTVFLMVYVIDKTTADFKRYLLLLLHHLLAYGS